MIGIYIVDGILLLGLGYLCYASHKKADDNLVYQEDSLEKYNNYLSFNHNKNEIIALV